ncbi:hypothetical protein FHX51_000393 [Aeriscardovia aeriphila]|uniref:Uncharacterized protein n=1 Tax=Aeriscardovia aeriphila TaxID=218139 RepID=A0A261FBA2_9BIFI|nr:hypothetical protein [Aeriscardovia aeriphila]OZG56402.1 hypothetical protein AEAE_0890 [Aeriscardovia aeriphila]
MGFWIGLGFLLNTMMTADQWGGPHWLVSLGQGICTLSIPAGAIAGIWSICHDVRTTPTHSEPSHDDRQSKDR